MKIVAHQFLDPVNLSQSELYDLLAGAIAPRPIALVSTSDEAGHGNLAPFSFFMPGGVNPPSVAFSPTLNMKGQPKDTLANIESTQEFTINLVDRSMAEGMNLAGFGFPSDVSEWSVAGFTGTPGQNVRCCRIAESKIAFECSLFEIVRHGEGPSAAVYVIGEVLGCFVEDSLFELNRLDLSTFRPIGRLGASEYVDLAVPEIFEMKRPK